MKFMLCLISAVVFSIPRPEVARILGQYLEEKDSLDISNSIGVKYISDDKIIHSYILNPDWDLEKTTWRDSIFDGGKAAYIRIRESEVLSTGCSYYYEYVRRHGHHKTFGVMELNNTNSDSIFIETISRVEGIE